MENVTDKFNDSGLGHLWTINLCLLQPTVHAFITDIYFKFKHNYVPCCHWYSYHGLHLCVFVSQSLWNNIIIVVAKQVPECDVEVVVECEGCGTKLQHL